MALVGISLLALCVLAGCNSRMKETAHGVVVKVTGEARLVRLEVVNDDVIRVSATAGKIFSKRQSLMANYTYPTEKTWTVAKRDDGAVELATPALRAIVQTDGTVSFTDADGHPILAEQGRTLTPMAGFNETYLPSKTLFLQGINYYHSSEAIVYFYFLYFFFIDLHIPMVLTKYEDNA